MNRRHFLACSVGCLSAAAGATGHRYGRAYFGWGTPGFTPPTEQPSWETAIAGRVQSVTGERIVLQLEARRPIRDAVVVGVRDRAYPDGEAGKTVYSEPTRLEEAGSTACLSLPLPTAVRSMDGSWFYEAYVGRTPTGDADESRVRFLCESEPYRMADSGRLAAGSRQYPLRPAPGAARVTRERSGSTLAMTYDWPDREGENGDRWSVTHRVRRSAYDAARGRERGHVRTYEETIRHPEVGRLAAAITAAVSSSASTTTAEAASSAQTPMNSGESIYTGGRFLAFVRFVQNLPYGHDQDVLGRFDYNRTAEETLVDGTGDCKDKTNLLAGLLEQSQFECDTALICQPSHILLGVSPADVPESLNPDERAIEINGRRYLPIESTRPTPIGEYPRSNLITGVYDGEWVYYDPFAVWPIARSVTDDLLTMHR